MTRVTISVQGTLLGLAFLASACQGELRLRDAPVAQTADLAAAPDLATPLDGVSFADINRDMDQPILGCTVATGACHGTDKPVGVMKLKGGFATSGDMAALMANYTAVLQEVTLNNPEVSSLLVRPLDKSGATHTGGKVFKDQNDPVYQRWLKWIRLGARLEFVPYSQLGNPADLSAPADLGMPNGGG